MTTLKIVATEDLVSRWESLFPEYAKTLESLQKLLIVLEKQKKELSIIRDELIERKIDIDNEPKPDEPPQR